MWISTSLDENLEHFGEQRPDTFSTSYMASPKFLCVNDMKIWGIIVDSSGSTTTSMLHRQVEATKHFQAHRGSLGNKQLMVSKRMHALASGTIRSLLWGSGGRHQMQKTSGNFTNMAIRIRWRHTKRALFSGKEETKKIAAELRHNCGLVDISQQVARSMHKWAGHVVRSSPSQCPAASLHWWRCSQRWITSHQFGMFKDPHDKLRWKHN